MFARIDSFCVHLQTVERKGEYLARRHTGDMRHWPFGLKLQTSITQSTTGNTFRVHKL